MDFEPLTRDQVAAYGRRCLRAIVYVLLAPIAWLIGGLALLIPSGYLLEAAGWQATPSSGAAFGMSFMFVWGLIVVGTVLFKVDRLRRCPRCGVSNFPWVGLEVLHPPNSCESCKQPLTLALFDELAAEPETRDLGS